MSKCKCVCCDHDDEKPQWKYMKSELREKNKMSQMQDALKVLEKLKQENAILREALEVYANQNNWVFDPFTSQRIFVSSSDPWIIAQKALEQTK